MNANPTLFDTAATSDLQAKCDRLEAVIDWIIRHYPDNGNSWYEHQCHERALAAKENREPRL